MYKVAYVPLDERPCNHSFPGFLAEKQEVELVRPHLDLMGNKKMPGNVEAIWEWLYEEAIDCDGLILSLDTLIYGGLVPSRLHSFSLEDCKESLTRLTMIKKINPSIKIYAFNLIMRCPRYSSNDEEPDYYADWGREIFEIGRLTHLHVSDLATEEESNERIKLEREIPSAFLKDYLTRRKINVEVNKLVLEYARQGIIDFLVIPQDDAAPYGWTAMDQQEVRKRIAADELELGVYMYPGADEVGCTLLARMLNQFEGKRPLVYPYFSSVEGPSVTPLYEDRPLLESIKYQILAAGGLMTSDIQEADFALFINSPVTPMMEAVHQQNPSTRYEVNRNLIEFVERLDYTIREGKLSCVVADVAFANGADLSLIKLLKRKNLLFTLAGYAGWNTSSNTLGTCIAQGMIHNLYGSTPSHYNFLALRYVEDAGYCSMVRMNVTQNNLADIGCNYFLVDGQRGKVSEIVRKKLIEFSENHLADKEGDIVIRDCYMPWNRMFEVGLQVEYIPKGKEENK